MKRIVNVLGAVTLLTLGSACTQFGAGSGTGLKLVGTYKTGEKKGTEIISVQQSTARAVLTNSKKNTIEVLDLTNPEKPVSLAKYEISAGEGEFEMTSAAFHPSRDYFAVALENKYPTMAGVVVVMAASNGGHLSEIPVGVGPDGIIFTPDGRYLIVANEAEEFTFDDEARVFASRAGTITVIDFVEGPYSPTLIELPLSDQSDTPGFVSAADKRFLEREVDFGNITPKDGEVVGTFEGAEVKVKEDDGEMLVWIPVTGNSPALLEPEYVAASPDGRRTYVSLQENSGIVVIDPVEAMIVDYWGLGTTTHKADLNDDGMKLFTSDMTALREPDGIAVTPDGRYLLTADEGDTDPKAAKTKPGLPAGGGRTLSVVDLSTGKVVGDTGAQIDEMAKAAAIYPDDRSDNKGSEPENVVSFAKGGIQYAVVGLERANGVALVSLENPAAPKVLGVTPIESGSKAPEGLALYEKDGYLYIYAANEKSGDVSIFRF